MRSIFKGQTRGKYTEFGAWLTGYITAYSLLTDGVSDYANGADYEGMLSWIDKYCLENPLESFGRASLNLMNKFDELRPQHQSKESLKNAR